MATNTVEVDGVSYHLYARPNAKDPNRVWWYWVWEHYTDTVDGKPTPAKRRLRRSTGMRMKREAVEHVKALSGSSAETLGEYVAEVGFFENRESCPWLRLKEKRKVGYREHTRLEHVKNINDYILPLFSSFRLDQLTAPTIETAIHNLRRVSRAKKPSKAAGRELSASTKDGVWRTLKIVLTAAAKAGRIHGVPTVDLLRTKGGSNQPNKLTAAEIRVLFPDSLTELEHVWRAPSLHANGADQTGKAGEDPHGLCFGLLFKVMLHAGLRPGEARALSKDGIFPDKCLVWIKQQFDADGNISDPKMSRGEARRTRFVQLPRATMDQLVWWSNTVEGEMLFTLAGRTISKDYLVDRFRTGLVNAGIEVGARKLTPYSLRYTFRSRAEGVLDGEDVQRLMGHRDKSISDRYLEISADMVEQWTGSQERIESLWK